MAHELRTRARSSGRAAVERRTAFIGPTPPASERVPPRMWCTVNHLGMMTYSGRPDADASCVFVVSLHRHHDPPPTHPGRERGGWGRPRERRTGKRPGGGHTPAARPP